MLAVSFAFFRNHQFSLSYSGVERITANLLNRGSLNPGLLAFLCYVSLYRHIQSLVSQKRPRLRLLTNVSFGGKSSYGWKCDDDDDDDDNDDNDDDDDAAAAAADDDDVDDDDDDDDDGNDDDDEDDNDDGDDDDDGHDDDGDDDGDNDDGHDEDDDDADDDGDDADDDGGDNDDDDDDDDVAYHIYQNKLRTPMADAVLISNMQFILTDGYKRKKRTNTVMSITLTLGI